MNCIQCRFLSPRKSQNKTKHWLIFLPVTRGMWKWNVCVLQISRRMRLSSAISTRLVQSENAPTSECGSMWLIIAGCVLSTIAIAVGSPHNCSIQAQLTLSFCHRVTRRVGTPSRAAEPATLERSNYENLLNPSEHTATARDRPPVVLGATAAPWGTCARKPQEFQALKALGAEAEMPHADNVPGLWPTTLAQRKRDKERDSGI